MANPLAPSLLSLIERLAKGWHGEAECGPESLNRNQFFSSWTEQDFSFFGVCVGGHRSVAVIS